MTDGEWRIMDDRQSTTDKGGGTRRDKGEEGGREHERQTTEGVEGFERRIKEKRWRIQHDKQTDESAHLL